MSGETKTASPIREFGDYEGGEEDGFDPAEGCGRWRNGRLAAYRNCLMAEPNSATGTALTIRRNVHERGS